MIIQTSLQNTDFISFEYIPRNKNARSYGRYTVNILRKFHIVFCNGHTNYNSRHSVKGFFMYCLSSTLVIFSLFENNHPKRLCHCVFLIYICLLISDTKHHFYIPVWSFVCLLWEKVHSGSLLFFNCVLYFLQLKLKQKTYLQS